jgi:cytidylate kinase
MAELVVTIDGPAASGKSTVARLVASQLGAAYLDTGAMYRAVTLAAMRRGVHLQDEDALCGVVEANRFEFSAGANGMIVEVNGEDVTEDVRDPLVTSNARFIASAPRVRALLVELQHAFAARHEPIVTEGRDQGTVAFEDADVKIFLVADVEERARRRQRELADKGREVLLEELKAEIEKRDRSDQSRTTGPLKPAEDAIEVDTTNMSIEQVVEKVLEIVREKR